MIAYRGTTVGVCGCRSRFGPRLRSTHALLKRPQRGCFGRTPRLCLRARPPLAQQQQEVGDADVAVEVGGDPLRFSLGVRPKQPRWGRFNKAWVDLRRGPKRDLQPQPPTALPWYAIIRPQCTHKNRLADPRRLHNLKVWRPPRPRSEPPLRPTDNPTAQVRIFLSKAAVCARVALGADISPWMDHH